MYMYFWGIVRVEAYESRVSPATHHRPTPTIQTFGFVGPKPEFKLLEARPVRHPQWRG